MEVGFIRMKFGDGRRGRVRSRTVGLMASLKAFGTHGYVHVVSRSCDFKRILLVKAWDV